MSTPRISIIIPTYNEANNIQALLRHLFQYADERIAEIVVCDAQSEDNTALLAEKNGAKVIVCTNCSRAAQMNTGAKQAVGNVLYFLHADSTPPITYVSDIVDGLRKSPVGCFQMEFDTPMFWLKINSFFTRFNGVFSGGGDQSLYITKALFQLLDGFDEKQVIMEDFEFVKRLRKAGNQLHILPSKVLASARKYDNNSYLRVNLVNFIMFIHFFKGTHPTKMKILYKKLLCS